MSRVAKNPIAIPTGVELTLVGNAMKVKGKKGTLEYTAHASVELCKGEKTFALSQLPLTITVKR